MNYQGEAPGPGAGGQEGESQDLGLIKVLLQPQPQGVFAQPASCCCHCCFTRWALGFDVPGS